MDRDISQTEIDYLLNVDKKCDDDKIYEYPDQGGRISIPLLSFDNRESFSFDITRAHIDITKNTFLNRTRTTIILLRLDLGGPNHRNPDGTEVATPHLHIYKAGYADKFAYPLPKEFDGCKTVPDFLYKFMDYCHIVKQPKFNIGLFV